MRILLVGNYALDHQVSMLRYADMLCRQMSERGHDVEVVRPPAIFGKLSTRSSLRKWLGYMDKYLLFPLQLRLRAREVDLVHVCDHSNSMYLACAGGRPSSITCHDLLAIESARGRYSEQQISYSGKLQQRWILKHLLAADNVVCVSTNTASELATLRGKRVQRVVVIPNALGSDFLPATEETVRRLRAKLGIGAEEGYLFHIGGNHWYKNRLGVLRIYRKLLGRIGSEAPALRLVMAGGPFTCTMRDFVTAMHLESKVIEVVDPSDEEVRSLYTGATALLFPSLYEGFGWPLIEAQQCGCPVITSNRLPMTEVAGSAALYIDPADEVAAADLIAANLERLSLTRQDGLRNARRFDQSVIFSKYDAFFRGAVLAKRSSGG